MRGMSFSEKLDKGVCREMGEKITDFFSEEHTFLNFTLRKLHT